MPPTHPESLVTVSQLQSKQSLTVEPHPKRRWKTCLANSLARLPADYTFPLPENNSKQIRHSICLGQLPQTVKSANKNTGWEVWPEEKALPLLVHFYIHQKLFSQTLDKLNVKYLTIYIILPILILQCRCSDQGIFPFFCKFFIRHLLISKYLKLYLFDTLN